MSWGSFDLVMVCKGKQRPASKVVYPPRHECSASALAILIHAVKAVPTALHT